ncbi:hypothetical protein NQ317_007088, partial [Molorchus minor]
NILSQFSIFPFYINAKMEFVIGGAAAVGAGFFTNPLEVLKTRMQLQGELRAKGQHAVYYKNVLHAGYVVAKNDGILALQKRFSSCTLGSTGTQWNEIRLITVITYGYFQFADSRGYTRDRDGNLVFYKTVLSGGFGGVLGQLLSSPLFLIKTHLQSQSTEAIAVGHQHQHKGFVHALTKIYLKHGVRGLFRGATASIPRAFFGSIAQLCSFQYAKDYLYTYPYFQDKPLLISFSGSMVGGVAISIVMTPFDLVMTRLYNQPTDTNGKGTLYFSYLDCVRKIYTTEGLSAFYKGVGPMYLRLGPHSILCLVFWDELQSIYNKYFGQKT